MSPRGRVNKHRTRSFIVLVLVVLISGIMLNDAGYLVHPFEFSKVMLSADLAPRPESEDMGFQMVDLSALGTDEATDDAAAGAAVDLAGDAPSADADWMPPDGGDHHAPGGDDRSLAAYFDFAWEDVGSVAYNLWVMLALTIAVIVIARLTGWLIKLSKLATARWQTVQKQA